MPHFLADLWKRGIASFRAAVRPTVGVFFVLKSDGKTLRLIFDTRRANVHFRRPWHSALPSASSLGSIETEVGAGMHLEQCDVGCAF